MKRSRKFWVMDYETLTNCFVACFLDYSSDSYHVFAVNNKRNDLAALYEFLDSNIEHEDWHFGFNNIAFDSQITEFLLSYREEFLELDSEKATAAIYAFAQRTIEKSRAKEFLDYPEFKLRIRVLDIYKLNHWDSVAKKCSLKWIQYSLDWYNVEEMPFSHTDRIENNEDLEKIISYCINDIYSTKEIFVRRDSKGNQIMAGQIDIRAALSKQYNVSLYSASEPKISKEIFLHFLSEKLKKNKKEIRALRTYRETVKGCDVILPSIKFETPEFQAVHKWFNNLIINTEVALKDLNSTEKKPKGPKYRMMHKGVPTDYALGGLHGCIKPGIYKSESKRIIKSVDVTSFYPNLAIRNKWSPAHINSKDFCELYEWFYDERKKYSKKDPLNYLFKIILNSTYGLSKEKNSFLYDPELTFKITINGQLQLSMLYEMLSTRIPNSQPLMQNTDGLEIIINEEHEELFNSICAEWEELTNLNLEHFNYKAMYIWDVNNYIAVFQDGSIKKKGRFEFEELPWHKNKSFSIIPQAIYNYFIEGIEPEKTINNCTNIFDFCAGAKLKGDWFFKERGVVNSEFYEKVHKKLIRYYVSNKGIKLSKCNPDGREIQLESGKPMQTIFNKYEHRAFEEYDVNKEYYIQKALKEIKQLEIPDPTQEGVQLTLF